MRKAWFAALVVAIVASFAVSAYAASPNVIGTNGASVWTYKDLQDSAAKYSGGYAKFTGSVVVTQQVDNGSYGYTTTVTTNDGYISSPHGGYDSTTNKCKVCHAVHRAQGAYYLLRADSQDDACTYCHIGGGAHSSKIVYDLNPNGIYTTNGHTIGAQTWIPDSTTRQYAQAVTLSSTDASGNPLSEVIDVRAYDTDRNTMYRFGRHHSQGDEGVGRSGYSKIGPLALRCMNCHQVHNAMDETWRPLAWQANGWATASPTQTAGVFDPDGYKLLKRYPSAATTGPINPSGYYNPGQNVKTIEGNAVPAAKGTASSVVIGSNGAIISTITATGGPWGGEQVNFSTDFSSAFAYSENGEKSAAPIWIAQDIHSPSTTDYPTAGTGYYRYPYFNSPYALSFWCADCHNLNIGGWEPLTDPELGFKAHTERTHPAPYYGAYSGPAQCYSCHRNDLSPIMGAAPGVGANKTGWGSGRNSPAGSSRNSCTQCHYGTADYWAEMDTGADLGLDFPHSGRVTDVKLLGSYTTSGAAPPLGAPGAATTLINKTISYDAADPASVENLDAVCLRCHPGIGVHH